MNVGCDRCPNCVPITVLYELCTREVISWVASCPWRIAPGDSWLAFQATTVGISVGLGRVLTAVVAATFEVSREVKRTGRFGEQ